MKLKIWVYGTVTGKTRLYKFFDVEGESSENPSEIKIVIDGDVHNTKWIGKA